MSPPVVNSFSVSIIGGILADSCDAHSGLWNAEAEKILFQHFGVK